MYTRCIILVADGARADVMEQLLCAGDLPNIKKHVVDRGCFRTALTVFPSTTGPAHVPFVAGIHPGTANVPGYRWLSRGTHDTKRRSLSRHRSLNNPRGMFLGADMDREASTSLFEYFAEPSAVLEPVDYCTNHKLYKVVARRLFSVGLAHLTGNWEPVDRMVERIILRRIKAGSDCIVATFLGIDEYSHLYGPFDARAIEAYRRVDTALGQVVEGLQAGGWYEETLLAILSDHGQTTTTVHIPVVDIVKAHGFNPHYYPRLYRRDRDSAVMESGNACAQLYFKRGERWGASWRLEEMMDEPRLSRLLDTLVHARGISFAAARSAAGSVVFVGRDGLLRAVQRNGGYEITVEGQSPLPGHPVGQIAKRELFEKTFDTVYPDAVNQLFLLFSSERSGDLILSSDPGYDLRFEHEHPEHHGSHGSLHRAHMQVPLAFSVPIQDRCFHTYDLVPTILALTRKRPTKPLDGRLLEIEDGFFPDAATGLNGEEEDDVRATPKKERVGWSIGVTGAIILIGILVTALFKDELFRFGQALMQAHGQETVDGILFLLTAVSSTPLALPIWGYALVGVAMGYHIVRLAVVMAVGSATGSLVTFLLGRYFGQRAWARRVFPSLEKHPWTYGRPRWVVTLSLFLGTASPLPCDVLYAACGLKRYPILLFWITMVAARFVRYLYLGYGYDFFLGFL